MPRLGLVGLPNAGKTSLFNALTGQDAPVAAHPFSTTETAIGVASVPDERLDALARLSSSAKVVRSQVQVTDIAGLAPGAASGEGLGNRFLAQIREVDAICLVLRGFADPSVPGEADPLASLELLELELVLADLASLQGQLERRRKAAKGDRSLQPLVEAAERAEAALSDGVPLWRAGLDPEDRGRLGELFLLTSKPVLAVINVSDDQLGSMEEVTKAVGASLGPEGEALAVAVQLEAEAARLDPQDQKELLDGLGLGAGVLPRLAAAMLRVVGRKTFFTTGPKESRAWDVRRGARAPECAGAIHSDLQRGFIRAEVIHADELIEIGSWARAKAEGRIRVEGKDYEVVDGDVLEIRFNV
jgi:GTP-binding protein YchF